MGEGANGIEDRRDGRQERLAGGGGAHRPNQAKAKRDPFKRLPMPCRDADSGMDQLMREDGGDLRRHGVGRMGEVGTDEDFEMPVRAQAIIPAFADRLTLAARAGVRPALVKPIATRIRASRGASSASNNGAMPAATRLSQLSRLSCSMPSTLLPSNRLTGDGQAIGRTRTPKNAGRRGGQRQSAGVARGAARLAE